jgi:hypothetical protein
MRVRAHGFHCRRKVCSIPLAGASAYHLLSTPPKLTCMDSYMPFVLDAYNRQVHMRHWYLSVIFKISM